SGYLRDYRCLIVLDNVETILESGQSFGRYRHGYEGYGTLIEQIGTNTHQSCLLLTSRELPQDLEYLRDPGINVVRLTGIGIEEGRMILQEKGLSASDEDYAALVD